MTHWIGIICLGIIILSSGLCWKPSWDRYQNHHHNGTSSQTVQGKNHSCYRTCIEGDTRTCVYNMTSSEFTTMAAYCGDCPYNQTDCFNPSCITAGGFKRVVSVINEMLPGPSIFVCVNDTVVVNLVNGYHTESTTIHWHGIHQRGTPWQDGVGFVSQCPILPADSYRYMWTAYPAGTHMWHGHLGYQEADGLFGQLVVREPNDIQSGYYDFDLAEHSMIVWHWLNQTSTEFFLDFEYTNGLLRGYDIIINGLAAKTIFNRNGTNYTTPRATFTVKKGYKYRFRMAFNAALYCPFQVSIDGHSMLMIASDSGEFQPINVTSFIGNAGERYDFVLNANADVNAYWIRIQAFGDICNIPSRNYYVVQEAILIYEGSSNKIPRQPTGFQGAKPGLLLNPVQQSLVNYTQNQVVKVSQLTSVVDTEKVSGTPDMTIYFEFRINAYLNMNLLLYYPQINNNSFQDPPSNLLTQYRSDKTYVCNPSLKKRNCNADGVCRCPYVQYIPLGSLVEAVLVNTDTGSDFNEDHPIHLHGYDFQVVAMETVGRNISVDYVRRLNEAGQIRKSFYRRTKKDTISIPNSGFAVFRFQANNPGYWLMHCHFSDHVVPGMSMVMKVGNDGPEIPQPSRDFPKCNNYPKRRGRSY